MAAQKGRELLIKVDTTGAGSFSTIGGLRARSASFNAETVDVTDGDSVNQWRELLENAGIRSATFTGSGIFKDSASEGTVRTYFFSGAIQEYQVIIPAFGTIEGLFQITALDYAGDYNGEVTYSLTLESAGVLTFTAA